MVGEDTKPAGTPAPDLAGAGANDALAARLVENARLGIRRLRAESDLDAALALALDRAAADRPEARR